MTYHEWLELHTKNKQTILNKLTNHSNDEIIEYFDFDNMVKNEPEFCPLYLENKKCHNIDELNCYFCACPHFEIGNKKSICTINSKDRSNIVDDSGYVHQDCSRCTIPHTKEFVKKSI